MVKNILLGITGGIAAYKSATVARLLIKLGYNVRVMMSPEAEKFITPLTFESLTGNKVLSSIYNDEAISHIEFAEWADICIVAPATANTIGKIASGIADNPITSTLMALNVPLVIAPAMNSNMWANQFVQENIMKLQSNGVYIINPTSGELACGIQGVGRMREPEDIINDLKMIISSIMVVPKKKISLTAETEGEEKIEQSLVGIKILVTAGPTREAIDPARYITNRSSGKMGYAVAEIAKSMGAEVLLISGEVSISTTVKNVVKVESAIEMLQQVEKYLSWCDIFIMSAAVADYRVDNISSKKIKKKDNFSINLIKNPDILLEASQIKDNNQIIIGFAAESDNIYENAKDKLTRKNLDMIVANDIMKQGIGFDSDDNEVSLLFKNGKSIHIDKSPKRYIAQIILTEAALLLNKME